MSNSPEAVVHWPTISQVEKRGLTPYVQVTVCGSLQRIHFRFPHEVETHFRPNFLTAKQKGSTVQLFVSVDGKLVLVEQISRTPVLLRTGTH